MEPLTLGEMKEVLMSDQFKGYVAAGFINAIVLEDDTVSLVANSVILTNPIPVCLK